MKRYILFLFTMIVALAAFGQDELTVEERFLNEQAITNEMLAIQSLIDQNNRSQKITALQFIEGMLGDNPEGIQSDEERYEQVVNMLEELGSEGISKEVRENNRLVNYFPEVRRLAARLLGLVGGEEAREVLLTMIQNDFETMVLSEAVYSLGLIGPDDDGLTEGIVSRIVSTQDIVRPDNNFAFAAILSFRMLAEKKDGALNPSVFTALIQIAQGNYIRQVREAANELLQDLRTM